MRGKTKVDSELQKPEERKKRYAMVLLPYIRGLILGSAEKGVQAL